MSLPQKLPIDLMQTKWAAQLNPLLSNLLTQGSLLINVQLINGVTVVNHLLGRKMMGWMIADQDAAASIYRSAPLNDQTLTLTSNAATIARLWVF
jgi:hypothetical protein